MEKNRQLLIKRTPNFTHYLYDDSDCRAFLAKYFKPLVLKAYDKLIPGAFKADLWRYCIMYIYGGIYMDIKLNFDADFDPDTLLSSEHYPLDIPLCAPQGSLDKPYGKHCSLRVRGIYQGLLVCQKGSPIMREVIARCTANILNEYYGKHCLAVTGPGFLFDTITAIEPQLLDTQLLTSVKNHHFSEYGIVDHYVVKGTKRVCYPYRGYRGELIKRQQEPYATAWERRRMYK